MVKKVKKYPHAFFERNTWNHRTKKLLPDYTIKYGKKGGFETAEEAEKAYQEHIKEFDRKMNMTFLEVDKEVTLKNFLLYWYVSIFSERVQSTTRYLVSYVLYGMLLPNIDEKKTEAGDSMEDGYFKIWITFVVLVMEDQDLPHTYIPIIKN